MAEKSGYHGLITYRIIVDWRLTIMAKTQEELNKIKEEVETLNNKLKELTDEELKQVIGGTVPPINKDEQYVMLGGGAIFWKTDKLPTEPGNYKLGADANTVFTPWMQ